MSQTDNQSQFSKASSSGINTRKLGEARHLYPLLQCFESSWPTTLVQLGLIAEMVQMLALVINHWFPWGGIVSGISIPTYFTILPFWDQEYYVHTTFVYYSVLFWIVIAVMFGFLGICSTLIHLISEQLDRHGQDVGKLVLHLLSGVFYLPVMHLLLSFAVCDQNHQYIAAFASEQCLTGVYNIILFALAVAGLAILTIIKIAGTLFLYDDHPASLHPRARPHNIVEVALVVFQIISVCLYHYMPYMGQKQAFAGIYALGCLIVAILHILYLPFFGQGINVFRVISLFVISYASMVACIILEKSDQPTADTANNWSSLVLLGGSFFVAVIGYYLANFRVSRQCLKDLEAALSGERSASNEKAVFPSNLPEEERIKYREHESIVLGEARFARTQESLTGPQQEREENRDELWVCSPYLEAVYSPQDVEVATRHVHLFQLLTGLRPPATMVAYGLRVFTKGLSKYVDSSWLELQFATYMCSLAPQRNQVALNICDRIARSEVDMFLGYRVSRRAATISAAMFIRDNSHKKSFVSAQLMHKEALINMKLFWGKLLADSVDIVQLGTLAKIITDRREEGLKFFERVVNESNDTFSLIRYAQFLEQVMMDTEAANNTREAVLDSLEQEQLGVTKDSSRQPVITSRQRNTSISRSRTISSLNFNINVIFSILFGVIAGLLIFGIVLHSQRASQADKVQAAGMARGLSQEVLVYVNMLVAADATTVSSVATALASKIDSFRSYHAQLTSGTFKTAYKKVVDVLTLPRGEFHSAATFAPMGLWELGEFMSSALETIIAADSSDTARQYAVALVRDNALDSAARLYNDSIAAYNEEAADQLHIGQYVMIGFYLLSLLILCVVYFVLILNFRKISSSKLSTLSLFTLIPKNALEKLMNEGKERIEKFDQPDEKFESMKIQRGLEDDSDAMNQVLAIDVDGDDDTNQESHTSLRNLPSKDPHSVVTGDDGNDDMDLHGKFATLLKNSTLGDTGKMKQVHHGQFETPYTKDMFFAPVESAEDIRERQRILNEIHVEQDLKSLRDAGSIEGHGNQGDSSDALDGAQRESKNSGIHAAMSGCVLLIFGLAIIVGALLIADLNANDTLQKYVGAYGSMMDDSHSLYRSIIDLRVASEEYVFHPSPTYYNRLMAVLRQSDVNRFKNQLLTSQANQAVFDGVFAMNDAHRVLAQQQLVAALIVCNASKLMCNELMSYVSWNGNLFVPPEALRIMSTDTLHLPLTPDNLLLMNVTEQKQAAYRIFSSKYFNHLQRVVISSLAAAENAIEAESATKINDQVQALYRNASAEVAVSALLVLVVLVCLAQSNTASSVSGFIVVVLASAALIAVVAPRTRENNIDFNFHQSVRLRSATNSTLANAEFLRENSVRVAYNGDEVAAMSVDAVGGAYVLEASWSEMASLIAPELYTPLSNAFESVRSVVYIDMIVASVGCKLNGFYEPPALNILWNFTDEVFSARTQRTFPTQVFYSDRTTDLQLPAAGKMSLIDNLLFGSFRSFHNEEGRNRIVAISQRNVKQLTDDILTKAGTDKNLIAAGAALAFACAFLGLLMIMMRLFDAIDSVNVTRVSDSSNQREDELFEKLTKQSQVALLLLALLFSVLFIFTIVDFSNSVKSSFDQNHASMREFYAIRSLAESQMGLNATWREASARGAALSMIDSSTKLYFGDGGVNTNGAVGSATLDQMLFGATAPSESRFDCTTASLTTSIVGNATILKTLALGVDMSQRRWADVIANLDQVSIVADRAAKIADIQGDFATVLSSMRSSTAEYTSISQANATSGLTGFLIILAFTFVALALLFFFVFRPMIGQLLNEEEGTKVMLKMIPAEVRESVPAIAEYLETGVVLQDMKMHEINEAAADLSTIPTITIDAQGSIVKFSRAAEDAFLWTKGETVGANVKMLMPENIAAEHDSYLSNYRKTGVKTIINRVRKIRARRKDGTLFPAEILVREVRSGRNTLFVGTLRNITVEIEFERAIVLSKAVSEAATVPIVVINGKGVIQRFNAAAEEAFRCGQEVVGRKVNVLMPLAEAEVHDSYIERYLKTGIKTIIDGKRVLRAKKLTGELFPARLNIRELKRGSESIFIGYIEDMTKQVHLQMASMVSDAIMATSPVPLVAIDDVGNIISWSPAAAHTFGINVQDAVGKNVKFLMTENVAQRHDGYLQTYQKTGRKKMIGNVSLQKAKRKEEDGTTTIFPVKVAVKDIVQQGKNNYYVAFIQDVSKAQQLETEYKISSSITMLSSLPLVTIDERGIIQQFSAAAEACFGWLKSDVMGQNITCLMPPEHRADHDGYIDRYLKTGVKTVIDITRRVEGITREGNIFPIELMVREVKHDGKFNFVGYIRNVSEDFKMGEANAYSDAISQLATVPVVCIGVDGIIISCSDSCCDRFLWSRDELVGQNVAVLMPDSIGVKHDSHLKKYKSRLDTNGVVAARESSQLLHKERRVIARTRDEQQFHVAIHVRDLHIDGMQPMFVGYIRDLTDEINQTTQRTIADAIVSLSSIPLICISSVGTVTVFSNSAEKDFGYQASEVLGQNIKMLMPDEIATKHDGYLRAYAKTGIKSVIDSRRQAIAKKKSGTIFSVEITVKEVVQKDATGRDINEYIGFVRDLTQQFILLQANTINDVVSQLATVPIIIINTRGLILDFNAAGTKEFGYLPEEVMNKNIKILMPDDIAVHHDGFLQKYKTTKKKNVIDNTRRTTAKRRNGDTFPCEISVREVIKEGTEGQYIGYIRDVSHEQLLTKQHHINSAIIDLSTIPLVVIDIKGEISIFSRSAEETFGYTRQEMEGQNVKVLMPEEIGKVHDTYLANYARTGVKSIIDTSRRVRAVKKKGSVFPAEISVKEVKNDDGESIFIGYLQDCTQEAMLNSAAAFSECINALSPVPVIAIDHLGAIVRFSTAAEEEFRVAQDTIVGMNIKVLQPDEIAVVHDEYLARYVRTGVKTIINTTRAIECKRWDSTTFHAEITTREVVNKNDPEAMPNFVAYIRNIEHDLKIQEAFKEGNAMLELAPIPVIAISLRGIMMEVNPAAMQAFGYGRQEMIGQNIKKLMPAIIAQQHDGYLQRYLDTKQKTVIDTVRHVVAQRKSGTQFHVEIAVREIVVEGMENQYIGYVRDVTEDLKIAESASLNEAVNSLSSTPLIVTDPAGTIVKFSHAAEALFGYQMEEVLDKNVKMLMPPSIAIKHDRYLEVYKSTGKKTIVDSSRNVSAKKKDGTIFACEIGVREVLQNDGRTTSVFVGYIRSLDEEVLRVGQSAEVNAVMMDLATQGVIIIDRYGKIERVNEALTSMFQIPSPEAVVGQNIKSLMPDSIAENHDGYLKTYFETRVKHIINSTRQALGKEWGTTRTFPIEIAVREIIEKDKEIRYLGCIRRIDKELEMETIKKTSAAALDLSQYATVVIDSKGVIIMFSRAAEVMFEAESKQVIGKNVKILMPEDVGSHHDEYLATYRRTGEKHVIDSLRTMSARAVKSGRLFPVNVQIKECAFTIKGLESVFVGYISAKE